MYIHGASGQEAGLARNRGAGYGWIGIYMYVRRSVHVSTGKGGKLRGGCHVKMFGIVP